jgi:hypothetical protein
MSQTLTKYFFAFVWSAWLYNSTATNSAPAATQAQPPPSN